MFRAGDHQEDHPFVRTASSGVTLSRREPTSPMRFNRIGHRSVVVAIRAAILMVSKPVRGVGRRYNAVIKERVAVASTADQSRTVG
jgi:hypothetical protein